MNQRHSIVTESYWDNHRSSYIIHSMRIARPGYALPAIERIHAKRREMNRTIGREEEENNNIEPSAPNVVRE